MPITEEQKVILKTHEFLKSQHLNKQEVVRLYTDSHSTLTQLKDLDPFQRFYLNLGDFVLHPDLVGQLADGETLFAVEAKGDKDLVKGLAQAEMYQTGFHYSFLAAHSSAVTSSIERFARRKNIGVIAVDDDVKFVHTPEAQMPLIEPFRFISQQMGAVIQVAGQQTFHFNVPTHYLVWAIAFQPGTSYSKADLVTFIPGYPIPKEIDQAIAGARKLGILKDLGKAVQLTDIGVAVKDILATDLAKWALIHRTLVENSHKRLRLHKLLPSAAAILRLLLLQDAIVQLLIEALKTYPEHSANFTQLAVKCDQLDHARTPIFFFKPESLPKITNERGRILWQNVTNEHYRSKNFHQYKSILQHAGILFPNKLGGSSIKNSDPNNDIWKLL